MTNIEVIDGLNLQWRPVAVAFLASPHAGYITGSELHVNGGMFMN